MDAVYWIGTWIGFALALLGFCNFVQYQKKLRRDKRKTRGKLTEWQRLRVLSDRATGLSFMAGGLGAGLSLSICLAKGSGWLALPLALVGIALSLMYLCQALRLSSKSHQTYKTVANPQV